MLVHKHVFQTSSITNNPRNSTIYFTTLNRMWIEYELSRFFLICCCTYMPKRQYSIRFLLTILRFVMFFSVQGPILTNLDVCFHRVTELRWNACLSRRLVHTHVNVRVTILMTGRKQPAQSKGRSRSFSSMFSLTPACRLMFLVRCQIFQKLHYASADVGLWFKVLQRTWFLWYARSSFC